MDSDLKNYTSYWTSPSQALPMSLPSQVVSDKDGNVFFLEHGGNKIVKISSDNGIMTEFDIPTGPLATSVFLAVSEDQKRIWFTEWESNKIAYLDNTVQIPVNMVVRNNQTTSTHNYFPPVTLKQDESYSLNVGLTLDKNMSSLLLQSDDTELSVVGMTDVGLQGVGYTSNPQRVNLMNVTENDVDIELKVEGEKAIAGNYTIMIRASLLEKDGLILSLLYPHLVKLDVPTKPTEIKKIQNFQQFSSKNTGSHDSVLFRDLIRIGAIVVVVILVGYLVYHNIVCRIKFKKTKK